MPGVCMWTFAGPFFRVTRFRVRAGAFFFDFALAFGLVLFAPGILDMSCPSCWANTIAPETNETTITLAKSRCRYPKKFMS